MLLVFFEADELELTFVAVVLVETTLPVEVLALVLLPAVPELETALVLRLVVLLPLEPPLSELPLVKTLSDPVWCLCPLRCALFPGFSGL